MPYSYAKYTGNGSTYIFSIPFQYIAKGDVEVRVGGVLKAEGVNYSFASSTTIQLFSIPGAGVEVEVRRNTLKSARLVDFNNGAILTETGLDLSADQVMYIVQEAYDTASDAQTNAATGAAAASSSAAAAALSESNAATSEANADTSETNAAASAASALASKNAAGASETSAAASAATATTKSDLAAINAGVAADNALIASDSADSAVASAAAALSSKGIAEVHAYNAGVSAANANAYANDAGNYVIAAQVKVAAAEASAVESASSAAASALSAAAAAASAASTGLEGSVVNIGDQINGSVVNISATAVNYMRDAAYSLNTGVLVATSTQRQLTALDTVSTTNSSNNSNTVGHSIKSGVEGTGSAYMNIALRAYARWGGDGTLANAVANNAIPLVTGSGSITTADGYRVLAQINSTGGIGTFSGYAVNAPSVSGSGVITTFRGVSINNATLASMTTSHGVFVANQTAAATLTAAFTGQMTSGTGKWNCYMTGTANNLFYGNVKIGANATPAYTLDVTGTLGLTGAATVGSLTATGAATIGGTATFNGEAFFQQNATYNGTTAYYGSVLMSSANAGLEMGAANVANTPYIDFHSGATLTDFDARIMAWGGTGTAQQGNLAIQCGYLSVQVTTVEYTGTLSVAGATTVGSLTTTGAATVGSVSCSGAVEAVGKSGYKGGQGVGGTVTQATSKTTGVTLNKLAGQITMNSAALASTAAVRFTVTNSTVDATDTIIVNIKGSATGTHLVSVSAVNAGSFDITLLNWSGASRSEAVVLNFTVIKSTTD